VSLGLLTGCPSSNHESPAEAAAGPSIRNNCISLLHQLLEEQKDVSLLRFIKREHADVKELIKKVAATSKDGSKLLEQFAKNDPTFRLDEMDLPPGETATRDSIASTKKKEILGHIGDKFELELLLSQSEALSYGWHLAKVAAEKETEPERARALVGMGEEMRKQYEEVFDMLLLKEK
jgi:hypothetical protein